MGAYSFYDVTCSIDGEGGSFTIDGVAEEGITVEASGDQNTMKAGADGSVMHSMKSAVLGQVTLQLLKTSAVNADLMTMLNYQLSSATYWGTNTVTIEDTANGDIIILSNAAFKKYPPLTYATEAGDVLWVLEGQLSVSLGSD